ncbi:MAG: DUF4281 domain-containing protein [Gammaproteobacteria bacterium]|nr:DUF4281 domain-containing protein [Gammaproteobacteria bacterium]
MIFSNPAHQFELANSMALLGWVWLIVWLFLPSGLRTRTRWLGLVLPFLFAIMYAAAALVHFSSAEGSFQTLNGVLSLFDHPGATLGGWIHYLAFDLFVGWCIANHAINSKTHRFLVVPCLLLTFMLGPVGLLLYGAIVLTNGIIKRLNQRVSGTDLPLAALPVWHQWHFGQPTLAGTGLVLLLILPVLILAMSTDARTVLDSNVWIKPIKFSLSISIYVLSLSWFSIYMSDRWRTSRLYTLFCQLIVLVVALEMLWLIFAASIGEPSHFNQTHPILTPVYPLTGVLATILLALSLIVGVGVLLNKQSVLQPVVRFSLSYGLIVTFCLTLPLASYLAGNPAQTHAVYPDVTNLNKENAVLPVAVLPIVGWLRNAGDLRVAHFFATHAMHFVPLIALFVGVLLGQRARDSVQQAMLFATAITMVYSLFVVWTFYQAVSAKPFL